MGRVGKEDRETLTDIMTMKFGIWTTGRDEAALKLLKAIYKATRDGTIGGDISYIFCNREKGEGLWSDRIIEFSEKLAIPLIGLSSSKFEPALKKKDFEKWREKFHRVARSALSCFCEDVRALVGYMLILDAESCGNIPTINLHPAKPGGPKGTWQEVIWNLIQNDAEESGVMIHLVTPELDAGPSVSYCTFGIKKGRLSKLWKEHGTKIGQMKLSEIMKLEGETYPLSNEIRKIGLKREFPLLIHTLRILAEGEVKVEGENIVDREGQVLKQGYDLTKEINEVIK